MVLLITFIILYGFWVSLSGQFDVFHLSLGAISCAIIAPLSKDLFFSEKKAEKKHLHQILRFIKYLPWLLYQILLANLYVAYLVLHPNMDRLIDPRIIRFKIKLKTDISLTTFANSITLTPGTITVLFKENSFYVHAIDRKVAEDLLTGEMEDRVDRIYKEE